MQFILLMSAGSTRSGYKGYTVTLILSTIKKYPDQKLLAVDSLVQNSDTLYLMCC